MYPKIRSFNSKDTESLFLLRRSRRWGNIERAALRKLVELDLAANINDLRVPPGNKLESLVGDRKGQWSIRINDQFQICFRWNVDWPEDVEIVDYQSRSFAMTKHIAPVSPGEMLEREFLKPLGMTKYRLAKSIEVPAQRIGNIVTGKRGIMAETDLRLSRFFGLSEGWWLRLQGSYDTAIDKRKLNKALDKIVPLKEVALVTK